jgi:hypothetical protein
MFLKKLYYFLVINLPIANLYTIWYNLFRKRVEESAERFDNSFMGYNGKLTMSTIAQKTKTVNLLAVFWLI